ncbi:MAG: FxLYD domain-containing protein [Blastomonas sp.]
MPAAENAAETGADDARQDAWHDEPPMPDPVPPPPVSEPARAEAPAAARYDDDNPYAGSFDHAPPFRPRRNPARLWLILAGIFALIVASIMGAIAYFGLPGWVAEYGLPFAQTEPDLVIVAPPEDQERRTLPNGTELFAISGKIENRSRTNQPVLPLLVVLRDAQDRVVFSGTINPTVDSLAPGESVDFNEAMVDVPRSAHSAEIGWASID